MVKTLAVEMDQGPADVNTLSREFADLAARIQDLVAGSDGPIRNDHWESIDRVERQVDRCALDLRAGAADRASWLRALSDYEQAWAEAAGVCQSTLAA